MTLIQSTKCRLCAAEKEPGTAHICQPAQVEAQALRLLLAGLKTRTLARANAMDNPEDENPRAPEAADYDRLYSDVVSTLCAGEAIPTVPTPAKGRVWWAADDAAELLAVLPGYLERGATLIKLDVSNLPRVGYVLELVKADAPHILNYAPECDEWLIE